MSVITIIAVLIWIFMPKNNISVRSVSILDFIGSVIVNTDNKELIAHEGMGLKEGDIVVTGDNSLAHLQIDDNKVMTIDKNSILTLETLQQNDNTYKTNLVLLAGMINSSVSKSQFNDEYSVAVGNSTMNVTGTVFAVSIGDDQTPIISVFEGRVEAENSGKKVAIESGKSMKITKENFDSLELSDIDLSLYSSDILQDVVNELHKRSEQLPPDQQGKVMGVYDWIMQTVPGLTAPGMGMGGMNSDIEIESSDSINSDESTITTDELGNEIVGEKPNDPQQTNNDNVQSAGTPPSPPSPPSPPQSSSGTKKPASTTKRVIETVPNVSTTSTENEPIVNWVLPQQSDYTPAPPPVPSTTSVPPETTASPPTEYNHEAVVWIKKDGDYSLTHKPTFYKTIEEAAAYADENTNLELEIELLKSGVFFKKTLSDRSGGYANFTIHPKHTLFIPPKIIFYIKNSAVVNTGVIKNEGSIINEGKLNNLGEINNKGLIKNATLDSSIQILSDSQSENSPPPVIKNISGTLINLDNFYLNDHLISNPFQQNKEFKWNKALSQWKAFSG